MELPTKVKEMVMPEWAKFVAQDRNASWFCYNLHPEKPKYDADIWNNANGFDSHWEFVANTEKSDDWEDSLFEKTKEEEWTHVNS
jgi:hypothetical protein